MPVDPIPSAALAGRAATRAVGQLAVSIGDYFLPRGGRLDDRLRARLDRVLGGTVAAIVKALGGPDAPPVDAVVERLARAGLLRDPALMEEMIAAARQDLLAEDLRENGGGERQSLLIRLRDAPDPGVAAAAEALMVAENRRRSADHEGAAGYVLPRRLHRQLVWWVAAAVRAPDRAADIDRTVAAAAARVIDDHEEKGRPERLAMRLAAAVEATREELAPLLIDALADGLATLFAALVAHALDVPIEAARAIALEPEGDRLWLALRAVRLDRREIARIALLLADADPRRDIEAFADALDEIAAVDPQEARSALAPMTLPAEFQAAIRALGQSDSR